MASSSKKNTGSLHRLLAARSLIVDLQRGLLQLDSVLASVDDSSSAATDLALSTASIFEPVVVEHPIATVTATDADSDSNTFSINRRFSLFFDGTDDEASVSSFRPIEGTGAWSVAGWFKTSNSGTQAILHWGGSGASERIQITLENGVLWNRAVSNTAYGGGSLADGAWHHFAITQPAGGTVEDHKIYIDGSEVNVTTSGTDAFDLGTTYDLTLGVKDSGQDFFDGELRDIHVYDNVLTAEQVAILASDQTLTVDKRADYTRCPVVADRYVSPDGSDANDGQTLATAWATLAPLNTWIAAQTAGTYTAIIKAGTYTVTEGLELTGNVAKTVTIEFEEGVTIDQSASGSRTHGIDASSTPLATWVVNLRGAAFLGVDTSSGNGIGTDGAPVLTVNGIGADGKRATFTGFDDGISFHNTSGAVDDIIINDVECFGCSKAAVVHVNSARGTHNRCRFIGTAGSSVGIADDQSSVRSEFYDCEFLPSSSGANGEKATVKHAVRCKFGSPTMVIDNNNVDDQEWDYTDCYVNYDQDSFGSGTWTRCYGKLFVRLRGDASTTMTMRNCVWDCDGADFCYANFDGGEGWLGGVLDVQDTIFQNVNQVFEHHSAAQIAHIEANWTADYCLFHNVTRIHESGLDFATNSVVGDPLLGDADSAYQAAWTIGSGGAAENAGATGGNIGFAADEIPTNSTIHRVWEMHRQVSDTSIAADRINSNNATLSGAYWKGADEASEIRYHGVYNGSTSFTALDSSLTIDMSSAWMLEVEVRLDALPSSDHYNVLGSTSTAGLTLRVGTDGLWDFSFDDFTDASGAWRDIDLPTAGFTLGEWHRLRFTWDGVDTLEAFVGSPVQRGNIDYTSAGSQTLSSPGTTYADLNLGRRGNGTAYWLGSIRDFRFIQSSDYRYAFTDPHGTTLTGTGSAGNGTHNNVTIASELVGGATEVIGYEFIGSGDRRLQGTHPLAGATEFTMAVFVRFDDITQSYPMVISGNSATTVEMRLYSNTGRIEITDNSSGISASVITDNSVSQGELLHIAATYDGSDLKVYLNGDLEKSDSVSGSPNWSSELQLGARSTAFELDGFIGETVLYDSALDADAILKLSQGIIPSKPTAHYLPRNGNANVLPDIAGDNHLTVVGATTLSTPAGNIKATDGVKFNGSSGRVTVPTPATLNSAIIELWLTTTSAESQVFQVTADDGSVLAITLNSSIGTPTDITITDGSMALAVTDGTLAAGRPIKLIITTDASGDLFNAGIDLGYGSKAINVAAGATSFTAGDAQHSLGMPVGGVNAYDGVISYYKFSQSGSDDFESYFPAGKPVDISSNDNHGTATGTQAAGTLHANTNIDASLTAAYTYSVAVTDDHGNTFTKELTSTVVANEFIPSGAEGHGAATLGAYDSSNFEITDFTVSNTNDSGAGSLRAALETTGPTRVRFDASLDGSTIALTDDIAVPSYTSFCGSDALVKLTLDDDATPRSPIQIVNSHVYLKDVVSIPGRPANAANADVDQIDAIQIFNNGATPIDNVYIENSFLSGWCDEGFGVSNLARNVTIKNTIIAQGLINTGHENSAEHNYASLVNGSGSTKISYIGVAMANSNVRAPRFAIRGDYGELKNCWSHDCRDYLQMRSDSAGTDSHVNAFGCVFTLGPETSAASSAVEFSGEANARAFLIDTDQDLPSGLSSGTGTVLTAPTGDVTITEWESDAATIKQNILNNAGTTHTLAEQTQILYDMEHGHGGFIENTAQLSGDRVLSLLEELGSDEVAIPSFLGAAIPSFALEVKFRIPSTTANNIAPVAGWNTTGDKRGFLFFVKDTTGQLELRITDDGIGGTGNLLSLTGSTDVKDGDWHTVKFVVNDLAGGETGTGPLGADCTLDGSAESLTSNASGPQEIYAAGIDCTIGRWNGGTAGLEGIDIEYVKLWKSDGTGSPNRHYDFTTVDDWKDYGTDGVDAVPSVAPNNPRFKFADPV